MRILYTCSRHPEFLQKDFVIILILCWLRLIGKYSAKLVDWCYSFAISPLFWTHNSWIWPLSVTSRQFVVYTTWIILVYVSSGYQQHSAVGNLPPWWIYRIMSFTIKEMWRNLWTKGGEEVGNTSAQRNDQELTLNVQCKECRLLQTKKTKKEIFTQDFFTIVIFTVTLIIFVFNFTTVCFHAHLHLQPLVHCNF